jgi:hypothetical protein
MMPYSKKNVPLKMSSPADYRIVVCGRLNERYSSRLGGMNITTPDEEETGPVTILLGRLSDQAALMGILNNLYELHMPVLLVEQLGA